jgi:hypothetical protein
MLRATLARQTEFLTQTLISLDGIDAAEERDRRREQIKRVLTIQVYPFSPSPLSLSSLPSASLPLVLSKLVLIIV